MQTVVEVESFVSRTSWCLIAPCSSLRFRSRLEDRKPALLLLDLLVRSVVCRGRFCVQSTSRRELEMRDKMLA
jgi:hypothetical protein